MKIVENFLTKNRCYTKPRTIFVEKLILHSPGVAQPDASGMIERMNNPESTVCVHAYVEEDQVIQTLPWDYKGNHIGVGKNGSYNSCSIGIEVCEPKGHKYPESGGSTMIGYDVAKNEAYFAKIYENTVELFARLCHDNNLNPLDDILCHSEAHAAGYGSNHGDVMHWFPKHGKNMNIFRSDVKQRLDVNRIPDGPITADSPKDDIMWSQSKLNLLLPEIEGIIPLKIDGIYGSKMRIAVLIYWDKLKWGLHLRDNGKGIGDSTIKAFVAGRTE